MVSGLVLMMSCQKDVDRFTPNGTPVGVDTNWVSIISSSSPISELRVSLDKHNILDSIDCSIGGSIVTPEGLSIFISPASFLLSNGLPANGKLYSESLLIKQRGDMILVDKPTTSNGRILISGGEVFLKFRKESEEVHLAPGKRVYLKYADPAPSPLMRVFMGDESNPERFNWVPVSDSFNLVGIGNPNSPAYEFATSNLRWVNCDRFADTSGQRVSVVASLPIDYTNANTAVYLVFHDINSMLGMYGDQTTKKFASPKVPVGRSVVVVSISKKGPNSYYLGHQSVTTALTGTVASQVVPLSPQPTSLSDIRAYLATL